MNPLGEPTHDKEDSDNTKMLEVQYFYFLPCL